MKSKALKKVPKERHQSFPLLSKLSEESLVQMTQLVMPEHTNPLGNIFGGTVMSWIDIACAIAASRHSGRICVTASIDELHFLKPIKLGYVVNLRAFLTGVHRTSCEVKCIVSAENPRSGEKFQTATAYLTFVALDDYGLPTPMPTLKARNADEKKLQKESEIRREHRKKLKEQLKDSLKT